MRIELSICENSEDQLMCELTRQATINRLYDNEKNINLKHTFYLSAGNYIIDSEDTDIVYFIIGKLSEKKDFFQLDRTIFSIDNNFYIHKSLVKKIKHNHLISNGRVSIIKKLSSLITSDVYLVPDEEIESNNSDMILPWSVYLELVAKFPKRTELDHYAHQRISNIIIDYLNLKEDYDEIFLNYLDRKKGTKNIQRKDILFSREFDNSIVKNEIEKYNIALEKLKENIKLDSYAEVKWQEDILNILVLIFPQYKLAIKEVGLSNKKRIDFILVDLFNNIDLIEIKSHSKSIIKKKYRDNYVPSHELSGAIMQMEKYIYYLTNDVKTNTQKINEKISNVKEKINITSPKGFIIMGRTNDFDDEMIRDYRIIKNKYANIINIFSYDELIQMLEELIGRFSGNGLDITE